MKKLIIKLCRAIFTTNEIKFYNHNEQQWMVYSELSFFGILLDAEVNTWI